MNQKIIFIGSIKEYLEWDKDPDKHKKFEIVVDINKLRKEVKNMSNNDERKFTKEEALVNTYMAEHKGVSYRDAVLACGIKSSEGLGATKEEFTNLTSDEINRAKKTIDDLIYNLSLAKKSDSFRKTDQDKLDKAYNLVKEVEESVKILVEKNV